MLQIPPIITQPIHTLNLLVQLIQVQCAIINELTWKGINFNGSDRPISGCSASFNRYVRLYSSFGRSAKACLGSFMGSGTKTVCETTKRLKAFS